VIIVGGFGSYLLGLNRRTYEQAGIDTPGNTPGSTKEPAIGWMTAFLFVTSFVGLLALVPIRKVVIFHSSIVLNEFHDFALDSSNAIAYSNVAEELVYKVSV